ncbi:OprD family porin [Azotobacter beijerinckii]|nr:OprD family porin [Azotobacter beijerinckii]
MQLAISGTIIGGFIEDSTATLYLRNYYFMRDFSDIQGPVGFDAPVWG